MKIIKEKIMLKRIRTERATYRKNKETLNAEILTTLIGEIETEEKRNGIIFSDDDVIKVVQKFIKNINQTLAIHPTDILKYEKAFLEKYLPKQLSEEELKIIASDFKIVGEYMKFLKQNYSGKYDSKFAMEVFKLLGEK